MTINSQKSIPSIPEKVLEVNSYANTAFHDQVKEQHRSHHPDFENPMHVVDDLERYLRQKITGFPREILEAMARFNLREQSATVNDIHKALKGKHYDMVRRTIRELSDKKGNPFIITLQDKKGKAHQYVLANMQDIVKHENKVKGKGTSSMECNNDTNDSSYYHYNNILESMLIKILSDKPNPEIHNITLETQLKYSEDYKCLYGDEWSRPSPRNQAKVLECSHSRHRKYTIMVYPNGKVMIAIEATNHPFQWYSYDDWTIIRGEICGSIHQRLKDRLSIEPLIHTSVDEWTVKQFDINYDVPTSPFFVSILPPSSSSTTNRKTSSKEPMTIAWPCIKVKQLGRVYQVYSKQLPYKGSCLRFEEQKSFSSHTQAPPLSSLTHTFTPPLPEHILNVVFPQYLQLSQAYSSIHDYPLYHMRERDEQ